MEYRLRGGATSQISGARSFRLRIRCAFRTETSCLTTACTAPSLEAGNLAIPDDDYGKSATPWNWTDGAIAAYRLLVHAGDMIAQALSRLGRRPCRKVTQQELQPVLGGK